MLTIAGVEHCRDVMALVDAVVAAIDTARVVERPFFHLEFEPVFPDDIYARMIAAMPIAHKYRPLPGRNNGNLREDGTSTRVELDLFPEYIRRVAPAKRPVRDLVGRALTSREVQSAFVRRLAPGFERRFGKNFAAVGMYPIPGAARCFPAPHPHHLSRTRGGRIAAQGESDKIRAQHGPCVRGRSGHIVRTRNSQTSRGHRGRGFDGTSCRNSSGRRRFVGQASAANPSRSLRAVDWLPFHAGITDCEDPGLSSFSLGRWSETGSEMVQWTPSGSRENVVCAPNW
jgi:hypothetical protein